MTALSVTMIEDRREQILPVLSQRERERLNRFGSVVHFAKGQRLATTGEDVPGMYVILRSGSTKRVAAAVGEGAQLVQIIHGYLEEAAPRTA